MDSPAEERIIRDAGTTYLEKCSAHGFEPDKAMRHSHGEAVLRKLATLTGEIREMIESEGIARDDVLEFITEELRLP